MNCIIHKFLIQRECKRCSRPYFVSFSSSQIIFIIPGKRHVLLEINLPKDLQQSVLCYPHPTISRPSSDRRTSTQTTTEYSFSIDRDYSFSIDLNLSDNNMEILTHQYAQIKKCSKILQCYKCIEVSIIFKQFRCGLNARVMYKQLAKKLTRLLTRRPAFVSKNQHYYSTWQCCQSFGTATRKR